MNALEHKLAFVRKVQAKRLQGREGEIVFPEFDWNSLKSPPIIYFLPMQVINQLRAIISDVKLMNKPTKKYSMVNDLLIPYGFRHLASGTNRRTFYCTYNDNIVIKIASDIVGRQDNISEFKLQELIKPFCPKVYDVLPDGLIALSERVEAMTESDYKQVWTSDIFDFIFQIFLRGYIMEDVGANFFKNWGIRYGFGPVILDFPYIYEVDWEKLKCTKEDPRTGIPCHGDLDYDYSRGMSEIVCRECGTRYSAKYLAKGRVQFFESCVERGDKGMFNNNFILPNVGIMRNGVFTPCHPEIAESVPTKAAAIVDRPVANPTNVKTISINMNTQNVTNTAAGFQRVPKFNVIDRNNKKQQRRGPVYHEVVNETFEEKKVIKPVNEPIEEYHFYDKAVHRDIISFLKRIESNHSSKTAIELAGRLKVRFFTKDEYKPASADIEGRVTVVNNNRPRVDIEPSTPVTSPESVITKEDDKSWKTRDININSLDKSLEEFVNTPSEEVKSFKLVSNRMDGDKIDVSASKVTQEKPTEGLFPVKPKTREELMEEEMNNRNETTIMGFPGEPLVDTMKFSAITPKIAERVKDKFDNFKTEIKDIDEICETLSVNIEEEIKDDIKKLIPDQYQYLTVTVTPGFDERNTECFNVEADCRGTYIFSTNLYKYQEEEENMYDDLLNNQDALDKFFDQKVDAFDSGSYDDMGENDSKQKLKNDLIGYLYSELLACRQNNIQFGNTINDALEKAKDYVYRKYDFDEEVTTSVEESQNIVDITSEL